MLPYGQLLILDHVPRTSARSPIITLPVPSFLFVLVSFPPAYMLYPFSFSHPTLISSPPRSHRLFAASLPSAMRTHFTELRLQVLHKLQFGLVPGSTGYE
eukprot:764344-Hanusia_phi.AAC.2